MNISGATTHPLQYLSTNFTYAEAIASETAERNGINNTPDEAAKATMISAATRLERIRDFLHNPIHVNSWFRCLQLNRALGSKDTSQHIRGEAIDFICPQFGTPTDIAKALLPHLSLFGIDQLILEHTWVHISFAILSGKPRNSVLSLLQGGHYPNGLTDISGVPII